MNYNDGKWHGWNGGECPVHPESEVEVACGDGLSRGEARSHEPWDVEAGTLPIIAFRVIKEHKEPREWWIDLKPYGDYPVVSHTPMSGSYIHVREVIE